MNKLVIVILVIAVLGAGAFFLTKKSRTATTPASSQTNQYQSPVPANNNYPSPVASSQPAGTTSKTQLDTELNQELNQLDKDITTGSKEDVTDSDMNFN